MRFKVYLSSGKIGVSIMHNILADGSFDLRNTYLKIDSPGGIRLLIRSCALSLTSYKKSVLLPCLKNCNISNKKSWTIFSISEILAASW